MGFKVPLDVQVTMAGLPAPEREYRFWNGRKFAFDLAWPDLKLAVEIEGGIYRRGEPCPMCRQKPPGAHSSIERMLTDMEKYNKANLDGWMLIRLLPEETDKGTALTKIELALLTLQLRQDDIRAKLPFDPREPTMMIVERKAKAKRWKELKLKLKKP